MELSKCPKEFIDFGLILSEESQKIILKYFRSKFNIDTKKDYTPVTIADTETESLIRDLISKRYPDHGVLGEEYENLNTEKEFTWVIDPIDGTRSFIAGHKDFGTLIALLHNGIPILGIINCPAHNERWLGSVNEHTLLNGKIINTSTTDSLEECYSFTSGLYFESRNGFREGYDRLINRIKYHRFGGDCYMYGMLASGLIDIVVEDTLKPHDYMALLPVIQGAGGIATDGYGNKITLKSDGSFVASCSLNIHKQVIKILSL
tara:strand:- start:19 stop:804 length:786 start_codon:yes stop_codon:yes gene_type:complete